MARFIDADQLRAVMYHEAFEKDSDWQKWDGGCWIRYKMFEACIEAIPTADVRENVKGEWIFNNLNDGNGIVYHCTSCNWLTRHNLYAYCPNCGADMRGEQDGLLYDVS